VKTEILMENIVMIVGIVSLTKMKNQFNEQNLYYKGISIDRANKIFIEGIQGEYYRRFNRKVVYLSKSKVVAETYAKQTNGVVAVISANNLNIMPSGHSNQFIVNSHIPKENIIEVYRVEKIIGGVKNGL